MIKKSSLEPLNYDDVLMLPTHSDIKSRDSVYIYKPYKTDYYDYIPIFSSPMQSISEVPLVIELDKSGGVGILHRFFKDTKDRYDSVDKISQVAKHFGVSIGINDYLEELKFVKYAVKNNCRFIVVDTASGYLKITLDAVKELNLFRNINNLDFKIIAGNVVDEIGCNKLVEYGADIIRLGIGNGIQCLTSKSIGIGCPILTVIQDCSNIKKKYPNVMLLADGGIRNSGDALKAICFGADGVMVGSLFGRAIECENSGIIYGMSSFMLQERMNKTKKSNEGTVTLIPKEEMRPFKDIFSEFVYGLKSGLSYIGCDDINKVHDMDVEYIKVK